MTDYGLEVPTATGSSATSLEVVLARLRLSKAAAPGPMKTSRSKDQQNRTTESPSFWMGSKPSG